MLASALRALTDLAIVLLVFVLPLASALALPVWIGVRAWKRFSPPATAITAD